MNLIPETFNLCFEALLHVHAAESYSRCHLATPLRDHKCSPFEADKHFNIRCGAKSTCPGVTGLFRGALFHKRRCVCVFVCAWLPDVCRPGGGCSVCGSPVSLLQSQVKSPCRCDERREQLTHCWHLCWTSEELQLSDVFVVICLLR